MENIKHFLLSNIFQSTQISGIFWEFSQIMFLFQSVEFLPQNILKTLGKNIVGINNMNLGMCFSRVEKEKNEEKREKFTKKEKSIGNWSETNDLERLYTIENELLFV